MKKRIRNIIGEEAEKILESGGKHDDLYDSTERITKIIVKFLSGYVEKYKTDLFDGYEWEFSIPEIPANDIQEKTLIGKIKVNVEYTHSSENKITGSFKKVKLLDNGYYLVFLEVKVKINDDIKNHFNQIEYLVSHELHHAFRNIKTINKESKERFLNRAKNYTNKEAEKLIKDNPELKEFMEMIYLSLASEMEARQQETATQLKNIKTDSSTKTIEYLQQFQPINDARRMLNYSTQKILELDIDLLNKFIEIFNKNLNELGLKNQIKKTPEIFFKYWRNIITSNGDILLKKILRMVSDKHQLKEGLIHLEIEDDLLQEIFGSDS